MKTIYKVSEFVDYAGKTRPFVIAAVCDFDEDEYSNFSKVISLGISACRANDAFDPELGITIAEGKAKKCKDHALYLTDGGLCNDTLVHALLDQEENYFKRNPGYYLAGYDNDKEKYLKMCEKKEYERSLNGDEKITYNFLRKASKEVINKMASILCLGR